MKYLIGYLAIGVLTLVAMLISHLKQEKPKFRFRSELMESIYPERKKWWYRLLDKIVAPVLAGAAVIAVWPIAIFMAVKERFFRKEPEPVPAPKEFSVTRDDLLQQTTIEEIEQRERVIDPMGAVPDLPFGHLNAAWLQFKGHVEPQDSIWTFSSNWTTDWGRREIRAGYVILHGDSLGPHFLTTWKALDED